MPYRIFIDQGHNPRNPNAGAEGNGLREQDITYDVGVRLAALLNANPDFEARLSRNSPDTVLGASNAESLRLRVAAANSWPADYFISIHTNASDIPNASGSEAYVFAANTTAFYFAEQILAGLNAATGLADRGVFVRPTLYVLRKTAMPAVLVELGFITTPSDAFLMRDRPDLFARGIYNGIRAYLGL